MSGVGRLRERITIEAPTRTGDGTGGAALTWAALATVWAEVTTKSGAEVAAGERMEARARLTIRLRYRDDVTSAMRIVWRGAQLNIRAVRDPDGARRWLIIEAEGGGA